MVRFLLHARAGRGRTFWPGRRRLLLPPPLTLQPFFLPAPPPPSFSNANGAELRWSPSSDSALFLEGEFMDSRAAFVKFSSAGAQNYFFWLNNFCLGLCLSVTAEEEEPRSGSAAPGGRDPKRKGAPARRSVSIRKATKVIRNQAPLRGRSLESLLAVSHQPHRMVYRLLKCLHSGKTAVALALAANQFKKVVKKKNNCVKWLKL